MRQTARELSVNVKYFLCWPYECAIKQQKRSLLESVLARNLKKNKLNRRHPIG